MTKRFCSEDYDLERKYALERQNISVPHVVPKVYDFSKLNPEDKKNSVLNQLNIDKVLKDQKFGTELNKHIQLFTGNVFESWKNGHFRSKTSNISCKGRKYYIDTNGQYVMMSDIYGDRAFLQFILGVSTICAPEAEISIELIYYGRNGEDINLPEGDWNGYSHLYRGLIILMRFTPLDSFVKLKKPKWVDEEHLHIQVNLPIELSDEIKKICLH